MIVSFRGRKIELTVAPAVAFPGDDEFGGNIDLDLEVPKDLKAKDFLPFLWIKTASGVLVDTLGYEDVSPGRISLTFHVLGSEEPTPTTVELFFGPQKIARKIADVPVVS